MLGAIEMEVGVDCVEISRFSKQNASFFKKVFTDEEIEYCNNVIQDPTAHGKLGKLKGISTNPKIFHINK